MKTKLVISKKPVLPKGYVNKGLGSQPVRSARDVALPPVVEQRMFDPRSTTTAVIEAVFAADRFGDRGKALADLIDSETPLTQYDRYVIADYIRRQHPKTKSTTPVYNWTETDKKLEDAADHARGLVSIKGLKVKDAVEKAAARCRVGAEVLMAHYTNARPHTRKMRQRWAGPKE